MTEERIKDILGYLQSPPEYNYWGHLGGDADPFGGSVAWGYNITYNPQKGIYYWEDTEDVGIGFAPVASFQLSEAELIEKLRKIKE